MKSNAKLELARRIMENTGTSLFLTGKAGTGKTTFLRELRASTRKRMVVTAPTGIAAINAGGVTLHSFFQLDFGIFLPGKVAKQHHEKYRISKEKLKIIRGMDILVIDEVSMVRADLLDAVDDALRRLRDRTRPFGGVQLLLIGDLLQLPPVAPEEEERILRTVYPSNYFFDSQALRQLHYETVELDEVFRQDDAEFLDILNGIRDRRLTPEMLATLNSKVRPDFNPDDREGYIRLTTHNNIAARINDERLSLLHEPEITFECHVEGKFPENSYPADSSLRLKKGAQVMFIKNDTAIPRQYYNGMIGRVVAIDPEEGIAVEPTSGGEIIHVQPAEWQNISYTVDPETKELVEKHEGSFFQYPVRTAWAVTIHKSQGLTFDRAIVDIRHSFAHGQAYVALSRCRNLKGLVLTGPVTQSAFISDSTVNRYFSTHNAGHISEEYLSGLERQYLVHLLDEFFSFRQLFASMEGVVRLFQENYARTAPSMVQQWAKAYEELRPGINSVADKFRARYTELVAQGEQGREKLQERIKAASRYFLEQLEPLRQLLGSTPAAGGSKKTRIKANDRVELFRDLLTTKILLFNAFHTQDFSTDIYLDLKAQAMLRDSRLPLRVPKPKNIKPATPAPESAVTEIPAIPKSLKKTAKQKVPKVKKTPSWEITFNMLDEGKSLREIAEERKLTETTVASHVLNNYGDPERLLRYLPQLVHAEVLDELRAFAKEHRETDMTTTEIREMMGGRPTWDDIRFVLRAYECSYRLPEVKIVKEPGAPYGDPNSFLE